MNLEPQFSRDKRIDDERLMRTAIKIMNDALETGNGDPFGAVIAKEGQVISSSGTTVLQDNDPTGHAEINAIRKACKALGTWDLSDCVLYTSCQCCPMCYSASYWAKLKAIYYGCSWLDYCDCAPEAPLIKEDIGKTAHQTSIPQIQLLQHEASIAWDRFRNYKKPRSV